MDSKKIANNLKAERVRAGLKVEQVANIMQLTKATIYNYERDASHIEIDKLFRLALLYNCSIHDFFKQ